MEETDEGRYIFQYDDTYIKNNFVPVSLTLPIRDLPYESNILFPFFDGLIPEGWLLSVFSKNWKMNPRDRMGILLLACQDCIGSVKVTPYE